MTSQPTHRPTTPRVVTEPGYGITIHDGRHTLTINELGPVLVIGPGHGVRLDTPAVAALVAALTAYLDRYPTGLP